MNTALATVFTIGTIPFPTWPATGTGWRHRCGVGASDR